jgi:hypothetical protein
MKLVKTAAGSVALAERDKRIGSKMRMLLVTVDGTNDEAQLRKIAQDIGAPPDAVEQLFELGLIQAPLAPLADNTNSGAVAPALSADAPAMDAFARFRLAAAIMNELASDAMGLKAFFFVLKVEKCGTIADVAQLMPGLEPAVLKAHGESAGAQLLKPLKDLIAQGA